MEYVKAKSQSSASRASALVLALVASGCAVGPDFQPPAASLQDNWIEKPDRRVSNNEVKRD